MTHGDTVADADGREFNRRTASSGNAEFDGFGNIAQVDMAGNDFIKGITDTDQRLLQIFIAIAHSVEQRTMGGSGNALFNNITAHGIHPFFTYP